LVLLSKIIQSLVRTNGTLASKAIHYSLGKQQLQASGVEFDGSKETYMTILNKYLVDHQPTIQRISTAIAVRKPLLSHIFDLALTLLSLSLSHRMRHTFYNALATT